MKKTRFAEMLSALNKTDYKRFTDLVNSPYFNKNERVKKLWQWILENPKPDYTKEEIINVITPQGEEALTDANFRMVIADFVRLAEVFLLLERNELISTQRDELIAALSEKKLQKSYNKHLRILKEQTKSEKNKGVSYYNDLYFIECEELVRDKQKNKPKRMRTINDLTDYMWLCMKLDNFAKAHALGIDLNELSFYNEICRMIEQNKKSFAKHHPVIYSRWLMLRPNKVSL